jgi:hypothetical protein
MAIFYRELRTLSPAWSESESESELLYDWQFTANHFALAPSPLRITARIFLSQLNTCGHSPCITSSLARGWVYHLQLLLALANAFILGTESRGTPDHILLSQIRDSPKLEGQVPVFISPRNMVAQLYPQALDYFSSPPPTRRDKVEVFEPASTRGYPIRQSDSFKVKFMLRLMVPSASLSWNKAPIWGLRPDLYYCQTVAGLLMWGALSDERTGLSFGRLSQQ